MLCFALYWIKPCEFRFRTCAMHGMLTTMTSVTTALPTLGQVFGRADISPWVGTAYLLTSTVKPLSYFCSSETDQSVSRQLNRSMEDYQIFLAESSPFWAVYSYS